MKKGCLRINACKYTKIFIWCLGVVLSVCSCQTNNSNTRQPSLKDAKDTVVEEVQMTEEEMPPPPPPPPPVYSNARFKRVRAFKVKDHEYRVTGEAQVFEAAFSWILEKDTHEIAQGHEKTDAGAPAWGAFQFTVTVKEANQNSPLHLILYEASAKDGSRQHQLRMRLQ